MGLIDINKFYSRMTLLLEASIEDLRKQWIETGKMTPEQFQVIEKAAQGKSSWVTWLGKRVLEGQLTLKDEDIEKWQDTIRLFERYKQRFPIKDVNQIKTRDQINQFIQTALDLKQQAVSKDTATQAAKFLHEKFGIEIPNKLLIAFDPNLPDPADLVVVPDLEGKTVYYAKNNVDILRLKSMLSATYLDPGYIYANKPSELGEGKGEFIGCEKGEKGWRLSEGWRGSGCTESQSVAFVKYLLSKDIKKYEYVRIPSGKVINVLRREVLKQYRQEDYEGATEIYLIRKPLEDSVESLLPEYGYGGMGDALLFTLGKKVLLARENKFVVDGKDQMSKIKTLKEDGAAKVKAILEHFNVDCKAFKEGLAKYFPQLLGANDEEVKEWNKVQKVPNLLRDPKIQDQMREVDVPLYRSRGRVIRLHQYAYPTTWDSVKGSFRKSIDPGNYRTIVEYVGSEESPVYLYDNNGSWNCVIVCKDQEGRTTGIIRRQGYGQSLSWNISNAYWREDEIEARQLDEVFNPVQKYRLMYLAGLLD